MVPLGAPPRRCGVRLNSTPWCSAPPLPAPAVVTCSDQRVRSNGDSATAGFYVRALSRARAKAGGLCLLVSYRR